MPIDVWMYTSAAASGGCRARCREGGDRLFPGAVLVSVILALACHVALEARRAWVERTRRWISGPR